MSPAARTTRRRQAPRRRPRGNHRRRQRLHRRQLPPRRLRPQHPAHRPPQEPPTLEPCESSLTSTGIVVRSNITEPLIERDPNSGDLQPLLSTGWRQTSPNRMDVRHPQGRHLLQRRTVHRRGRRLLHRPRRQLRSATATSTATCSATTSSKLDAANDTTLTVGTDDAGSDSAAAHLVRRDRAPHHQHHREGARADRHRPVRHRGLGVRPEAASSSATTPTGARSRRSPGPSTSGAARAASAPR